MQDWRKSFCCSLRGYIRPSPVRLFVSSSLIGLRFWKVVFCVFLLDRAEVIFPNRKRWRAEFSLGGRWLFRSESRLVSLSHVCSVCCERSFYAERLCRTPVLGKVCSRVFCCSKINFDVCLVGYPWLRRDVVCVVVVACSCVYLGPITLDTVNSSTLTVSLSSSYAHHCISWSGWCDRYSI